MATTPSKAKSSSNRSKNKRWLANAIKSMGTASAVTFKSIAPNISSTAVGAKQAVKESQRTIAKVKKTSVGKIAKKLGKNEYVKVARKTIATGKRDLKSGKLFNPVREEEKTANAQLKDLGGINFDEFENWADDAEGNVTFNYIDADEDSGGGVDPGSSMVAEAINASSGMALQATQASIDALVGVSSETIQTLRDGFADGSGKLDAINSTLSAILEYHQENTTNFYNAATAAFERIGATIEDAVESKDDEVASMFGSKGQFDINKYKTYVKDKIKRAVDGSPVGSLASMIKDPNMLEAMLSDPIGGLTKGLIGGLMPRVVEGTLREVDKTFGNLIPNMLVRVSQWADSNESGIKGGIKKWIGSVFGIDVDVSNKINMKEVTKDAATFDQITRNSIVEVLPKYARESTSYLREIAKHITRTKEKDVDKLLANQQIFDTRTNSYKTKEALTEELTKSLQDAVNSAFTSTDFGKLLSGVADTLNSKDKKRYGETLDQFFAQLATSKNMSVADYDIDNENSKINAVLQRTGGTKKSKQLLKEAIRRMYTDNVAIDSAARAQINAQTEWNKQLKEMGTGSEEFNLHALGIDGEVDILEFLERRQKNTAARRARYNEKKEEEKREKESETSDDSVKKKFQSASKTVEAAMEDWKSTERYERDKALGKHGKIAQTLFGENFGKEFKRAGNHAKNGMFMIMKGDANAAAKEFSSIFTDQVKNMWGGITTHFFSPLAKRLFGDKDAEGEEAEGLFSGVGNKFSDFRKAFIQRIDGKEYTDSKGEIHRKREDEETLVDKASNVFRTVKESIFGKKDGEDEDGKSNVFKSFRDSISEGLKGWREAIFGEEGNEEENANFDKTRIKEAILNHAPTAIMGSAGGALVGTLSTGSLLGTLIGGPIGGAVLGFAGSFLARSDRFKDYLFGPEVEETDANGNVFKRRIGGLISEKTQKFFKDNKSSIVSGAVLGAIKNMVFPNSFGLLSSVVGGPIAGAAVGVGFSLLKKSDMWQRFLYGDEEKGKQGVVQAFKSLFSGNKNKDSKDKENDKKGALKMLGMGSIGAVGGALTAGLIGKVGLLGAMLTPGGVIGGALLGSALGIAAGGNKFSKWLFGEKDPDTKERKGGMVQKFGNFMHTEVFSPMKSKLLWLLDDMKTTAKYDILENIRLPFVTIANRIHEKIDGIAEGIKGKVDELATRAITKFIAPLREQAHKFIFKPLRKITGTITNIVYTSAKLAITAPFKLAGRLMKLAHNMVVKTVFRVGNFAFKGVKGIFSFVKAGLNHTLFKPVGKLVGGIAKRVIGFFRKRKENKVEKGGGLIRKGLRGFNALRAKITKDEYKRGWFQNKADKQREIAENKKRAQIRSQRDYNRSKMAEILGYDVKYFSKENFEAAKEAAKLQKKKIKWRGGKHMEDLFEEDKDQTRRDLMKKSTAEIAKNGDSSDDIQVRQLSEQHRTNEYLKQIAEQNGISIEEARQLYDELKDQRKEDAERAGLDYDEETGEIRARDNDDKSSTPRDSDTGSDTDDAPKESLTKRMEREMEELGGVKNYLFSKAKHLKWNIRDGYSGSWLEKQLGRFKRKGEDSTEETTQENESRNIRDMFEDNDHARAKGGPMRANEPYLVGEGGTDPSAAEIVVPNTNSTVFSQQGSGIRTFISGMEPAVLSSLASNIIDGQKEFLREENVVNGNVVEARIVEFSPNAVKDLVPTDDKNTKVIPFPGLKPKSKDEAKIIPEGKKDKLSDVKSVGMYAKLKEKVDAAKEDAEDDARAEKTNEILTQIRDKNEKHHFNWASIFSKKGILTGGALLVGGMLMTKFPVILDVVKKVGAFIIDKIPAFIETIKGMLGKLSWVFDNKNREDNKTILDMVGENVKDLGEVGEDLKNGDIVGAAADFVLDEDGEYNAQSSYRMNFLQKKLHKMRRRIIKVKDKVKKAKNFVGKVKKGAKSAFNFIKNGGKKATTAAASDVVSTAASKAGKEIAEEVVEEGVEKGGKKLATESVKDVAEKGAKGLAGKAMGMVDDLLKLIVEKFSAKFPKIAGSKVFSVLGKLTKGLAKAAKSFGKIATKISAVIAGKTGSTALTLGLDRLVFGAVGALNGLTATSRLFQVDKEHVDWKMKAISAIFGAIDGATTMGAVANIIFGLVADICQFDPLNFIACALYSLISSEDEVKALNEANEEFHEQYEKYADDEIKKQYETQKKAGIIGKDVTLEQFKEGVDSGTYKVDHMSYLDYNADEHRSLGSSIGKAFSGGWKGIKHAVNGTKTYYDYEKGLRYEDNDDGTVTVYDKDGNDLGYVSKDAANIDSLVEEDKQEATLNRGKKNGITKDELNDVITDGYNSVAGTNITQKDVDKFVNRLMDYCKPESNMDKYDSELILPDKNDSENIKLSANIRAQMKPLVENGRVAVMSGKAIGEHATAKDKRVNKGTTYLEGGVSDAMDTSGRTVLGSSYAAASGGMGKGFGGRGKENGFTYYSQEDPRWKNKSYVSGVDDGATMGDTGCGPTAMAMVATQAAKGNEVSPTDMARAASESGFRDETGTNEKFIGYAGDRMGMSHTDVVNPSPAFIAKNAAAGNPVILNGVGGNGAFTPSGHYVVAVGTDEKGDIKVNDPRGRSYSKTYSAEELSRQSRKAWSFGGSGYNGTNYASSAANKFLDQKYGVGSASPYEPDWMSIVISVKKAIADKQLGYSQSNFTDITLNGRTIKTRTDCSGFVGTCLKFYGAIDENVNVTSSSLGGSGAITSKFTQMPFPGWDGCQQGDILVAPGSHTEIFSSIDPSGARWVYNCGSSSSNNSPGTTRGSNHNYTYIWRPTDAGTGTQVMSIDGTATLSGQAVSGKVPGNQQTASNSTESSGSTILSKIGNVFSKFASKAMDGILTGNWNYDFSDDGSGATTTASAGATSGGSASVGAADVNVAGSDVKEQTWNGLLSLGWSKEGAAAVMGNMEQESGVNPTAIQGNGKGPAAGIVQWENYNTRQGRFANMEKFANDRGKDWTDLGSQLAFMTQEMKDTSSGYYPSLGGMSAEQLMQTNDIDAGVMAFRRGFERCKDEHANDARRLGAAHSYYNMYKDRNPAGGTIQDGSQYASSAAQTFMQDKFGTGGNGVGNHKIDMGYSFGGNGPGSSRKAKVKLAKEQPRVNATLGETRKLKNRKDRSITQKFDTSSLEKLLQSVLNVLESIDGNTSKIEEISGNYQAVNTGGNVIVSNNTPQRNDVSVGTDYNPPQPRNSRNSELARRIARGR